MTRFLAYLRLALVLASIPGIALADPQWSDAAPSAAASFALNSVPAQACQCILAVDPLELHSEGFPTHWPPCVGRKLIAHIKVRNTCPYSVHVEHMGVRGRRDGIHFWDIGFWEIDIAAGATWELDPNNERPLEPGSYSFRISYSPDGMTWCEIGNQVDFTASPSCAPTPRPVYFPLVMKGGGA